MKYTFFWGGCYSNWEFSPFTCGGTMFLCAEQYMMYWKAKTFNDLEIAEQVMETESPKEQKALGKKIKNFNPAIWEVVGKPIMFEGLKQKFLQNPEMLVQLYQDRETTFVEASPHDRIWGIGFSEPNALQNIFNWGENRLGKLINKVAKALFDE